MARARRSAEEKTELVRKIEALRSDGDGMTIPKACKAAGVSPANYMNWRGPFGKTAIAKRGPRKMAKNYSSSSMQTIAVKAHGTTDLMFIGFGRSQDVLSAISNLATIFKDRVHDL